ncbi:MAG TPA: pyridoxamine kinase [Negativicutes bacterium]|nr:pyridoxamine kinase [Negativicutes bacterium]
MGNNTPRVAAIHDLSGFGRCALTVIIPVLSTMGIQVCPVPTAILSTHPGGFGPYVYRDMGDMMGNYMAHWKQLDLSFDCIYSGFLGSVQQTEVVAEFMKDMRKRGKPLVVIDPVMGDHGKLYGVYGEEMKDKMRHMIEAADIITPNLTEACFLTGITYDEKPMEVGEMKRLLKMLAQMGPDKVVITGVTEADGDSCNIAFEKDRYSYWKVPYRPIPGQYPGTGDIFASVMTGELIRGLSLSAALDKATQFLSYAVGMTYKCGTPEREGVLLEKALNWLISG